MNVPELMQQFRQVADIQTQATLKLPVPDLSGGKPTVTSDPCSPELKRIVDTLVDRAEALRTGRVDPRDDSMLLVTTDGLKAAPDRHRALRGTGVLRPVGAARRQGVLGL